MGESTTAHDVDAAQKQHHRGKTLARGKMTLCKRG